MRRIIRFPTAILLSLNLLCMVVSASDKQISRVNYVDGSYAIITTVSNCMTRTNVADSKTYTCYNSSDQKCFSYTLYATFSYNGSSARAESCAGSATIHLRGWDIDSHNEWTSGNAAYGSAVFSGPNGESRPVSLSLVCDKNGNVR